MRIPRQQNSPSRRRRRSTALFQFAGGRPEAYQDAQVVREISGSPPASRVAGVRSQYLASSTARLIEGSTSAPVGQVTLEPRSLRARVRSSSGAEMGPKQSRDHARISLCRSRSTIVSGTKTRQNDGSAPASNIRRGTVYVGIDVGKQWLDASAPGLKLKVPNTKSGCRDLWMAARKISRRVHFICEETGHYSVLIVSFLHARRAKVSVLSGLRVRQFAKASRLFAKTDLIDSRLLAEVGRTLKPRPKPKPDPILVRLRQITRRRTQIVRMIVKQKQQLCEIGLPISRKTAAAVERLLRDEISGLQDMGMKVIGKSAELSRLFAAICAVTGVGEITGMSILAEFPEIGRVNRRQAAAFAGLAPFNQDSGGKKGVRRIFGGRIHLRTSLYQAALNASRFNKILRRFYKRLRNRGKGGKVALVAVARKLLTYLNSLARRILFGQDTPKKTEYPRVGARRIVAKRDSHSHLRARRRAPGAFKRTKQRGRPHRLSARPKAAKA